MTTLADFKETPNLLEVAAKELQEDPKKLKAQIEVLRRWLSTQEHLTLLKSEAFLLRFLRVKKFDQMKSQLMLDDFATLRSSEDCAKVWFDYPKLDAANVLFEFMENGFFFPLGVNQKEELVVVFRAGTWDPVKDDFQVMIQSMCLCFDVLCMNPRVQIAGLVPIVDFDGFAQGHVTAWSNEAVAKLMFMQKAMPLRIKEVHYYKTSLIVNGIYDLFCMFLDESIVKMIRWHKTNEESLKEAIGEDILPPEYGGTNRSTSDLLSEWIGTVKEAWGKVDELREVSVENSLRPANTGTSIKDFLEKLKDNRSE